MPLLLQGCEQGTQTAFSVDPRSRSLDSWGQKSTSVLPSDIFPCNPVGYCHQSSPSDPFCSTFCASIARLIDCAAHFVRGRNIAEHRVIAPPLSKWRQKRQLISFANKLLAFGIYTLQQQWTSAISNRTVRPKYTWWTSIHWDIYVQSAGRHSKGNPLLLKYKEEGTCRHRGTQVGTE